MTAKESLRQDYLSFLDQYGLTPLGVPGNATELRVSVLEKLVRSAEIRADVAGARITRERLEEELRQSRGNPPGAGEVHPIDMLLERDNSAVEQAILRNKTYRHLYRNNVYVGVFPTGSVNAEARRSDNGYLILVNAGLPFFVTQIVNALNMRQDLGKVPDDEEITTTIAHIIVAYLRFGNPAAGPMPLVGGLDSQIVMFLTDACCQFVLAHEYAHILSGHFDRESPKLQVLPTNVGRVEFIKNDWEQEFEADAVGYELMIGGKNPDEVDLGIIDKAKAAMQSNMTPEDWCTFRKAAELMAALAAPFLFFAIDNVVSKTWAAIHQRDTAALLSQTHPSSEMRMEKFRKKTSWIPVEYLGHTIYAATLWKMTDAIARRAKAML